MTRTISEPVEIVLEPAADKRNCFYVGVRENDQLGTIRRVMLVSEDEHLDEATMGYAVMHAIAVKMSLPRPVRPG